MELAALPGDIKGRLVAFQMKFLAPMMLNFDVRIKTPDCAAKLQELLDFRKMPLDRVNVCKSEGYFDDVRGLGTCMGCH